MIISCSITWHVPASLSLHTLSIEVSTRVSSIIQNQTRAFTCPASPSTHPTRPLGVPDVDGFYLVCSRRAGYRPSPSSSPQRSPRPVLGGLARLCFNCLAADHIKVNYPFPARCYNCRSEGHFAASCPLPPRADAVGFKRGRSPTLSSGGRRVWQRTTLSSGGRRVWQRTTPS
jgi:hypothetical protein